MPLEKSTALRYGVRAMNDKSPVLVTGAAGCIGAWTIAALIRRGREPVAFDLSGDRRRLRLLVEDETANRVRWIEGDIADAGAFDGAVAAARPAAIIHLAALQVPFCKADPAAGARVNVVGQVNVFEAARRHGVRRLVYASSVAALPAPGKSRPATLYGVYKAADEGIAQVYAADWSVPSIGLRPHTVYGPARDQGLTSAPTKAMLAAAAGLPYVIPFEGALSFQYAGDVAEAFIGAADVKIEARETAVFDLAGSATRVADILAAIMRAVPRARVSASGPPLPFPAEFDDAPLRAVIGNRTLTGLDDGVARTVAAFKDLLARGLVAAEAA